MDKGIGLRIWHSNTSKRKFLILDNYGTGNLANVVGIPPITASVSGDGKTATISTSMNTNKLIGRYSAGSGVMQEISLDSTLSLSAGGILSVVSALPSGTSGQTLRYDNTNTVIATSALINDGTNIGIGITPSETLDVVGTLRVQANSGTPQSATGGTITTDGSYTVHTFTTGGTFTPNQNMSVDYLVVAGGGGGGGSAGGATAGGGGGAGGFLTASGQAVTAIAYTITVGGGGNGGAANARGSNGSNSSFGAIATATGGGGGGSYPTVVNGNSGGSGGGATNAGTGGAGTGGQGNNGGVGSNIKNGGGGGGGANAIGVDAPNGTDGGDGGIGIANSYSGTSTVYSSGGGGGGTLKGGGAGGATGGLGGSGTGTQTGGSAAANTGAGGGGGAEGGSNAGGDGGSGIVIIRYLTVASAIDSIQSDTDGRVGIGQSSPTAYLNLPAGSSTAGFAPVKFTAGTLLATKELGALEFTDDGTNGHLYITLNVSSVLTRVQIV